MADWSNTSMAAALDEYMYQFPEGHRLKISQVVADLIKGHADLAPKLRPGEDYQKTAERNVLIVASRNPDIYEYDKKTREIWRI